MARADGPFPYYKDRYGVDGDDIRAHTEDPATHAKAITVLAGELEGDEKRVATAIEGSIQTGVAQKSATSRTKVEEIAAMGTFAVAVLNRFASDVDTYENTVELLNKEWTRTVRSRVADVMRSPEFKKEGQEVDRAGIEADVRTFLEPRYTQAGVHLDEVADDVAETFREGPTNANLVDLVRQGLIPLAALTVYPTLVLTEEDLAFARLAAGLDVELPVSATPADVHAWWVALTPAMRASLTAQNPEFVGNTDGIPAADRSTANVARLPGLIKAKEDYVAAHPDDEEAAEDLAGLRTLDKLIGGSDVYAANPAYQLLLLDDSGHPLKAALSNGDVDSADIVSTWVGGTTSTVAGFPGDFSRMNNQSEEVALQLAAKDDPRRQVGILWLGYDAPDAIIDEGRINDAKDAGSVLSTIGNLLSRGDPFGEDSMDILLRDGGDTQDAINTRFAREGGPVLAQFLDGITATNPDARQTASAHSYGGAVLGEALHTTSSVDTVIVSGTPGMFADNADELRVSDGVYVSEAQWLDQDYSGVLNGGRPDWDKLKELATDGGDFVPDLGHFDDRFGSDPSTMPGVVNFDNGGRDQDGRTLTTPHGHSSYWDKDSTSLFNEAAAITGNHEDVHRR